MRTLLLADDNITVQRVIALTFAHEPVRVVTASDGHQAMDRVVVDRPDIVLVGTTLPQVNGYELARFMKSRAELRNVPVLLLSGAFETIDEAQLKSSGANGVIEKPVEPTTVISRVKELLGLKSEAETAASATGRLVTPAGVTPAHQAPPFHPTTQTTRGGDPGLPTVPRMVTSTRPMPPVEPRREPPPAAKGPAAAGTDDEYLESLESAFDSLDQQLAGHHPTHTTRGGDPGHHPTTHRGGDPGRAPATPAPPRNPSPPLDRAASGDPRSPGKRPQAGEGEPGNPVYEVDLDWFADSPARDNASAAREAIAKDLSVPQLRAEPAAPPSQHVYDVDDEWFAEDQKARQARELEQRQLAAEMGIHEVTLPEVEDRVREVHEVLEVHTVREVREVHEVPEVAAPPSQRAQEVRQEPVSRVESVQHVQHVEQRGQAQAPPSEIRNEIEITPETDDAIAMEPVPRTLPIDWFAMAGSKAAQRPEPRPVERAMVEAPELAAIDVRTVAPIANAGPDGARAASPRRVADDFAALLAFERGEQPAPPMIEPIIHAVTPEITPAMLEQIAATVADRLKGSIHVEPQAPEITGEMLKTLAFLVSGTLKDSIRIEPAAPEMSGEMLKTIAFLVSGHLRDQIRVEPAAPVITDAIVEQISATVAERLKDTVRVEPKAPDITDEMVERMAFSVADRLKDTVRIAPVAPEITDDMLARVSESVAARLKDSIRVEPAIPELNGAMLDQIAGTVAARLSDTVRESVQVETVAPEVTGDMLEHLAHRISERLQSSLPAAEKPEITEDMLNHVALSVSDRVQALMPAPAPPPQISDEMLDRVAARVAERMQGTFSMDGLRDSMTTAIRDTVRAVVSETSERLVREEIERIKSRTP